MYYDPTVDCHTQEFTMIAAVAGCVLAIFIVFPTILHHNDENVYCGSDFPLLHFGFCMTYNSTTGATGYGACPYIACYNTTHIAGDFYIQLLSNVSSLVENLIIYASQKSKRKLCVCDLKNISLCTCVQHVYHSLCSNL